MSFVVSAIVVGGSAIVGAGVSYYQGEKALKQQRNANSQAQEAAARAEKQANEAFNAANQRTPDILSLMRANALTAGGGISGTMLTGPSGVDAGKALLGKAVTLGK